MQIVIDIPQSWLADMKREEFIKVDALCQRILNGIPLPKHHGDLKDVDAIINANELNEVYYSYSNMMIHEVVDMLECADTIIPATKGESK